MMVFQPMQIDQEFKLFHQTPNDDKLYHITCKMILHDCHQKSEDLNSVSLDDSNYDYEFFLQSSNDSTPRHHVTCKLLSSILVVNILNKKVYGMDFDANDLKRKYSLTFHQKLNLELSLRQILSC